MSENLYEELDGMQLHDACDLVRKEARRTAIGNGLTRDQQDIMVDLAVSLYIKGRVRRKG